MEKIIGAFDARRQFGRILQDVLSRGDTFVVERHGERVAAVVPVEVYDSWRRSRSVFFDKLRAVAQEANLDPHEADVLAQEAVEAVRAHS